MKPVYLDCNSTTPLEEDVMSEMRQYLSFDFGNAGSRTHEMGSIASKAVNNSRKKIAEVLNADGSDILFTSGATESNNLAILGMEKFGKEENRKHIISSPAEHKATLEPLERLKEHGFTIDYLQVDSAGRVNIDELKEKINDQTLLITLIHANNETGVLNPISEIGDYLQESGSDVYFHVDAAQSFGKEIEPLQNSRIDMMSMSAHKIFGPKGIGALLLRSRNYEKPPLEPLMIGGGQERGLRPGTLAVPLITGFGKAAELSIRDNSERKIKCLDIRKKAIEAISSLGGIVNGDTENTLSHTLNVSIPGINSEAAMIVLKDIIYISNGSACTSSDYQLSHVLKSMKLPEKRIKEAIRISWCHLTEEINWEEVVQKLSSLKP